ncbi:MAG: tail fiber protein [Microthrixaceae bacterium]|nr:tail fiber protein [Microthrixaceae bacterium]
MTDISEPVVGGGSPVDDPEFTAMLDRLMPFMADAAKLAVAEAAATTPTTTYRPANVVGVDPALRNASVLCDGDTTPITAQVLTELPGQGDRVMVEFRAAGAVFVAGFITSCGTPPGTLAPYAGSISNHAGAVSGTATPGEPPRGWLWCAGQAVSRSTYPALYLAIGETWGAGDGATTFNVPDFRGREFRGLDNMGGSDAGRISAANTLGGTGGTGTITTSHLPSHTHDLGNHTHGAGSLAASSGGSHTHGTNATYNNGANAASAGGDVFVPLGSASVYSDGSHSHSLSGSTGTPSSNTSGSAGSGTEFLPPYALVHVIVKA